ncbi:MAG: hypothetical protein HRU35_00970 [Rickettsiaceae bacterium]|nr:hypothetical protein [Rickettsiaceae bacterium]
MSLVKTINFINPINIKQLSPELLFMLLKEHRYFFIKNGINFNKNNIDQLDYTKLSLTLLTSAPAKLIEALYFIYEMAKTNKQHILSAIAKKYDLDIINKYTRNDLAGLLWFKSPKLLKSLYTKTSTKESTSYQYLKLKNSNIYYHIPTSKQLLAIESELNNWFSQTSCKISFSQQENKIIILFSRYLLYRRNLSAKQKLISYRPEIHDFVIYDKKQQEIAIDSSMPQNQKDLYLTLISKYLFKSKNYFIPSKKFTLEPIKREGKASIQCSDIEGIDEIRLTKLQLRWQALTTNIFLESENYFNLQNLPFHELLGKSGADILAVEFSIKFTDSIRAKIIKIIPPDIIGLTFDQDNILVETWLKARGFYL